jgi:hypothetical protein
MPRRTLILLLVALAFSACAAPARPGTTYEVNNYSVTVPNDLGLTLPGYVDPETVWLTGPRNLSRTKPDNALIDIKVTPIDPAAFEGDPMMQAATAAVEFIEPEQLTGPTSRSIPAGPAVAVELTADGGLISAIYHVRGDWMVIFTGSNIPLADLTAVAESFRWRDPPGDAINPPSLAPWPSP